MNIVENFMDNEKAKVNWLEKFFQTYPVFYFAKDIQKEIKQDVGNRNYIVRPSKLKRTIAFLFICFGLLFWVTTLKLIFENILLPITVIFLLLVTCWIGFILWIFFLNPQYSYKITLNHSEIIIGKELIKWGLISDYLLMEKGGGRHLASTLVLFVDNKEIKLNSLENLNTSGKKLIKLIELYKK